MASAAIDKNFGRKALRVAFSALIALSLAMPVTITGPVSAYASEGDLAEIPSVEAHIEQNVDETLAGEVIDKPTSLLSLFTGDRSALTETGHYAFIKYLVCNSSEMQPDDTIDDVWFNYDVPPVLAQYGNTVPVYEVSEDADYYVAFTDNSRLTSIGEVRDWSFTEGNNNGIVIEGVIYDEEAGIIYIPRELYFNDEGEEIWFAVQQQLLVAYDLAAGTEVSVPVEIENNHSKVVAPSPAFELATDALDITVSVPVATPETAAYLDVSNFTVHLNGTGEANEIELTEEVAAYNSATGELELSLNPFVISSLHIEISGDGPLGLFTVKKAHAASAADLKTLPYWTYTGLNLGTLNVGDTYAYEGDYSIKGHTWDSGDSFYYIEQRIFANTKPYGYTWSANSGQSYTGLNSTTGLCDWTLGGTVMNGNAFSSQQVIDQAYSNGTMDGLSNASVQFTFTIPGINSTYPTNGSSAQDWSVRVDQDVADNVQPGKWTGGRNAVAGYCAHNTQDVGNSLSPAGQAYGTMHARVVAKGNDYVVLSLLSCVQQNGYGRLGQAAVGIYKFKVDAQGALSLQKTSADESITDGNGCYSLEGAVYGVYTNSACTTEFARLTTDASGKAALENVPQGTYYIKEISPSKGYGLDYTVYTAVVRSGQTTAVNGGSVLETPLNDPAGVLLQKVDGETGEAIAPGGASLAHAEYTFKFYPGAYYDTFDEAVANAEEADVRTWVLQTDELGSVFLSTDGDNTFVDRNGKECSYKVFGDAFYYSNDGYITLPFGTLTVQETKAPEGMLLSGKTFVQRVVEKDGQAVIEGDVRIVDGNAADEGFFSEESPKRGDLRFEKKSTETGTRLANVPFLITNEDTGESHVVVTDANGQFDSSVLNPEHRTNANDSASEGSYDATAGIWFGEGDPDDRVGAFLYGTYTVQELACEANEGLQLIAEAGVTISRNGYTVDLGTIDDPDCNISTSARDAADGDRNVSLDATAQVIDRVTYSGLLVGQEVTVTGTLMDKSTGESLKVNGREVTASKTFTTTDTAGYVELSFEFDATELAGKSLVAFEELSIGGRIVAEHKDIDDSEQTVDVVAPEVHTTASDAADGDRSVLAGPGATVNDTVSYSGLVPGETYTVVGSLMDKETGEAVKAKSGAAVTAEKQFTPAAASGTVEMGFYLDATNLAGKSVVVFERLYKDNVLVAEHADLDDPAQTVDVKAAVISTSAADAADGDDSIMNFPGMEIVDTVSYSGLVAGATYSVSGVLYDKSTGEPILIGGEEVRASTEFTPLDHYGTIEVRFPVDATGLAGKSVVVFETLFSGTSIIAEHADIDDEAQTVTVATPAIATQASDAVDGDNLVAAMPNQTVRDTVSYENLIAGETYTVSGVLMDKETGEAVEIDGEKVRASSEFKALDHYGSVEVAFAFDATELSGKSLVVFEYLTFGDALLATHADIDDEAQTVTVYSPEISTFAEAAVGGGKVLPADSSAGGIVDAVEYEGLPADGGSYTAYGLVVDAGTGLPLLTGAASDAAAKSFLEQWFAALGVAEDADGGYDFSAGADAAAVSRLIAANPEVASKAVFASKTFTPATANGTVEIEFDFDASALSGKTGVVFEVLVRDDAAQAVAVHADQTDTAQMFTVSKCSISTVAVDKADNDKTIQPAANQTVRDTVTYRGLLPGAQYELSGILYDKSTGKPLLVDGATVTAERLFSPNHSEGTVTLDFKLDATDVEGKSIVVFEYVTKDGEPVAEHADINDAAQTVTVKKPTMGSFFAKMGASITPFITLYAICGAGVAACLAYAFAQLRLERRESEARREV